MFLNIWETIGKGIIYMAASFTAILNKTDIDYFRNQVNDLHDAYLIHATFSHNGHTFGNPHRIDFQMAVLRLCFAVTSLPGTPVVELIFEGVLQWHLNSDPSGDMISTCLSIDEQGTIFWGDDQSAMLPECRDACSWVRASSVTWRICDGHSIEKEQH